MFAPSVEKLLWKAASWSDTSWSTRGKNRSSALLRAVERDSLSTSTWGHTCAYTQETAPTSAPLRFWQRNHLLCSHVDILQGCNKKFAQSTNLKSHILTHAKQKSGRGSVSSPDSVSGSHSNLDSHRSEFSLPSWWSHVFSKSIFLFIPVCNIDHLKPNQNWISALTSQTRHIFSQTAVSLYKPSLSR